MNDVTEKVVTEHEVIDHGYMVSDYFQGCGVAFTEFEEVATGIGSDRHEAYDDALEILAQGGWNVDSLRAAKDVGPKGRMPKDVSEDCYWHVSVRVK